MATATERTAEPSPRRVRRLGGVDGMRAIAAGFVFVYHGSVLLGARWVHAPPLGRHRAVRSARRVHLLRHQRVPAVPAVHRRDPRRPRVPGGRRSSGCGASLRILPAYWVALTLLWLVFDRITIPDTGDASHVLRAGAELPDRIRRRWARRRVDARHRDELLPRAAALLARAGRDRPGAPASRGRGTRSRARRCRARGSSAGSRCGSGTSGSGSSPPQHVGARGSRCRRPHDGCRATSTGSPAACCWPSWSSGPRGATACPAACSSSAITRGSRGRWPGAFLAADIAIDLPPNVYLGTPFQGIVVTLCTPLFATFLFLPAVIGDTRRASIRAILASAPMAWIGLVSYGDLSLAPADHGRHHRAHRRRRVPGPGSCGSGCGTRSAIVATLVVAAASYYLVERPCIRLSHRLGRRPAAPTVPVAVSEARP